LNSLLSGRAFAAKPLVVQPLLQRRRVCAPALASRQAAPWLHQRDAGSAGRLAVPGTTTFDSARRLHPLCVWQRPRRRCLEIFTMLRVVGCLASASLGRCEHRVEQPAALARLHRLGVAVVTQQVLRTGAHATAEVAGCRRVVRLLGQRQRRQQEAVRVHGQLALRRGVRALVARVVKVQWRQRLVFVVLLKHQHNRGWDNVEFGILAGIYQCFFQPVQHDGQLAVIHRSLEPDPFKVVENIRSVRYGLEFRSHIHESGGKSGKTGQT